MKSHKIYFKQKPLIKVSVLSFYGLCLFLSIIIILKPTPLKKDVSATTKYIYPNPTTSKLKEIEFWKGFLLEHPDYYDGWKRLSDLQKSLSDFDSSKTSLNAAKEIKPNN